jgi:SutA RNAP-binding domain
MISPKVDSIMSKSKKDLPVCDRDDLARQMAAFEKSGGKVQQIPTGTSGQTHTRGPRQIILSHKTAN